MTKAQIENEIVKQMKLLKLTREEATELVMEDLEIDKMTMKELQSDLTEEQKKAVKKASSTTATVTKKTSAPRERKVDAEKVTIIEALAHFVEELSTFGAENVKITKKEREIDFCVNNNNYTLSLVKHRKK